MFGEKVEDHFIYFMCVIITVYKSSPDGISSGTFSGTWGEIALGKIASLRGKHIMGKTHSDNTALCFFFLEKKQRIVFSGSTKMVSV